MINKSVLPHYSFNLLKQISANDAFKQFYLAGGTSLALQLGHRESVDLDFFTSQSFTTALLYDLPSEYKAMNIHNNSIEIVAQKTKVFFFRFMFTLYKPLIKNDGLILAHPVDIGLMKLLALQGRTTKKDFIDIYFIDKEVMKLEELLTIFEKHYPSESFNSYSSLKSLFDFEALNLQPLPKMFKSLEWEECRELVVEKITKYAKGVLNINLQS